MAISGASSGQHLRAVSTSSRASRIFLVFQLHRDFQMGKGVEKGFLFVVHPAIVAQNCMDVLPVRLPEIKGIISGKNRPTEKVRRAILTRSSRLLKIF